MLSSLPAKKGKKKLKDEEDSEKDEEQKQEEVSHFLSWHMLLPVMAHVTSGHGTCYFLSFNGKSL